MVEAEETIAATNAVAQKERIAAIGALLAVAHVLAMTTPDTVVTEFAGIDVGVVKAILRLIHPGTVVTIFAMIGGKYEIAVFIHACAIAVIAIDHRFLLLKSEAGHDIA